MSFSLPEQDVRHIVRILGKVAVMDSPPDQQRTYLMTELARLLGTDTTVWGVSPMLEPDKKPVYIYQQTGGFDEARMSLFLMAVEHPDTGAMTTPLAQAMISADSQVTRLIDQIVPTNVSAALRHGRFGKRRISAPL